jgi:hypothetical protein
VLVFQREDLSYYRTIGEEGNKADQFNYPLGIASYGDKYIYVTDSDNHRICIYQREDSEHHADCSAFVTSFGGNDVIPNPQFLCISDTDKKLYVTCEKGVVAFNLDDNSVDKIFGSYLKDPKGICLSSNGSSLFVIEVYGGNRISEVDITNDNILKSFTGAVGMKDSVLSNPYGICLSNDGAHVLVSESDSENSRISVFKQFDLSFVKHIASQGNQANQLNRPAGLYCDINGTIFVADSNNKRISIFKQ